MAKSVPEFDVDEVDVREVWARLQAPDSLLIDVRTAAEWEFVGVPDLAGIGKQPLLLEWQFFPGGHRNEAFAEQLTVKLEALGASPDTELFFICRSGGRSLAAAKVLARSGYRACRNVSGGFEGPPDARGRRGSVAGWKAAGLPWAQR